MFDNEKLLIISNNVLSTTTNNGKTLFSFFDVLPAENVNQLFFSGEEPSIEGYNYFRISDIDILKGKMNKNYRGERVSVKKSQNNEDNKLERKKHQYNSFERLLRELLWEKSWESDALWNWLDQIQPTTLFFLGGDACFAYQICLAIKEKYKSRLAVYITDDYVMPRQYEDPISYIRRKLVRNCLNKSLAEADVFFTISNIMAKDYYAEFGKKSYTIVNMSECLKEQKNFRNDECVKLVYAGSLYYGRDKVLKSLAETIEILNLQRKERKIKLFIYSNDLLNKKKIKQISRLSHTVFGGSLNAKELKHILNEMDIAVFVESFDKKYVEKVKYSLSTKIPEYMSLGKPILAIGPKEISSIDYLQDVAFCITQISQLYDGVNELTNDDLQQAKLARSAEKKYKLYHTKKNVQDKFLKILFDKMDVKNNEKYKID